jgi:F0F1-type ATP synthase assembly protein I
MKLLLIGLAIGVIVYVASGGHIIFLPLLLLVPFGWFFRGRRRTSLLRPRRRRWPWQGY